MIHRAQILLTGDVFYPGFLFVNDRRAFRQSIARLADFLAVHPVSMLLGCHIEMSRAPGLVYDYGTTYQPFEHALELHPRHLLELHAATEAMGDDLMRKVFDDFRPGDRLTGLRSRFYRSVEDVFSSPATLHTRAET